MKRITITFLLIITAILSFNKTTVKASGFENPEFYGIEFTHNDELKAAQILKQIKRGEKVVINNKKNKRLENIGAAFMYNYFPMMDIDDVIIDYGITIKGKEYTESNFPSKTKYKKLLKKEKRFEKEVKLKRKELDKWEQTIADECMIYPTQREQFIALEEYMINNMTYEFQDKLKDKYPYFTNNNNGGNPYVVYLTNKGVCCDFSVVVDEICEKMGIDCYIVSGSALRNDRKGDGAHAWNIVILDETITPVDVTWDINCKEIIYGPDVNKDMFNSNHFAYEIKKN